MQNTTPEELVNAIEGDIDGYIDARPEGLDRLQEAMEEEEDEERFDFFFQ